MKIKIIILLMIAGLGASAQWKNANPYGKQFNVVNGDTLVRDITNTSGQFIYSTTVKGVLNKLNYINVMDYGAKPDGVTQNDVFISNAISASTSGQAIYFPKGTYIIKENILLNKKGLRVIGEGVLKQVTSSSQVPSGDYPYSNYPMFKVLADSIRIEGLTFYPKFEAISTLGFDGLFLNNVKIIGTGQSIFPGVFFKDSKHIEVKNSTIKNIGVRSSLTQRSGHGIHINTSDYIKIYDCDIENNGGNGVFSFVSSNIRVENNRISRNGMSAFQLAFAPDTNYIQRNYFINNNLMQGNAADGVDVNNSGSLRQIDMFITNNVLKDNGFYNGAATVDGSGIGTFINVSNVNLTANKSYNNAGIGLYIYQSKDIVATDNVLNKTSVGSGIYAENSSYITLKGNTVNTQSAALRFTGTNSFVKISNNHFTSSASVSLEYPNDAVLNSYSIDHNDFTGFGTINGLFDLYYNNINSLSTQIALGLYSNGRILEGNKISSLGTALDITNVSNSYLKGNVLSGGSGAGSFPTLSISGSENTTLDNNSIRALNDDPAMLVSSTINKLTLFNNTFYGGSGNNIRYNPGSQIKVFQYGTVLNGGFFELGSAVINDVQYNVNGNITATGQAGFILTNGSTWNFNSDANRLYINETGIATRLQIEKTTGYVGIGRTPTDVLHVAGNIKSDGKVIVANAPVNPTDAVRKQELDLKADASSLSGYQTVSNLSSDLTSSSTKYPSVNAVNIGLGLKLNNINPSATGTLSTTGELHVGGDIIATANGSVFRYQHRLDTLLVGGFMGGENFDALQITGGVGGRHFKSLIPPTQANDIVRLGDISGYAKLSGGNSFSGVQNLTNGSVQPLAGFSDSGFINTLQSNTLGTNVTTFLPSSGGVLATLNDLSQTVSVSGTSQALSSNRVYIPHSASLTTFTLPATATEGQLFQIVGEGAGGWRISQNASQQIVGVNVATTSGTSGSVQSTNPNCTITIRCTVANSKFTITSSQGTLTIN